jgi:SAM-dependent methyltransferase
MRTLLHVGCGRKRKDSTTAGFNTSSWTEVRLDIDPEAGPDIVGTLQSMPAVGTSSMDAVFSSHNIEHLYAHEVPRALSEFLRVLKPEGFLVLTCPDLQSICALVSEDKLMEPAYTAPSGPIAPIDILFGHRASLASGNFFMAHRCGFTRSVLVNSLRQAGFAVTIATRRAHPFYDLWALACVSAIGETDLRALANEHFPIHRGR